MIKNNEYTHGRSGLRVEIKTHIDIAINKAIPLKMLGCLVVVSELQVMSYVRGLVYPGEER